MKWSTSVLLLTVGILTLLVPGSAGAKNLQSAVICGTSGCHHVIDRDLTVALVEGGASVPLPSHGAPWYRVRITFGGDGEHARLTQAVVPKLGLIRGYDAVTHQYRWIQMTEAGEKTYARLSHRLDPFPASSLGGLARPRAERAGAVQSPPDPPHAGSSGGSVNQGEGPPIWASTLIGAAVLGIGVGVWRRRRKA